jgi:hypothetical protein
MRGVMVEKYKMIPLFTHILVDDSASQAVGQDNQSRILG